MQSVKEVEQMGGLCLSRMRDQQVIFEIPPSNVSTLVICTVVDIRGDKVRTLYTAPRPVKIHRREVYDAIQRENKTNAAEAANNQEG